MKKTYLLTGLLLMIMACSEQPEKPKTESNPQIVSLRLSEHWNLNSTDSNIVEIKVTDPAGYGDLNNVIMKVYNSFSDEIFSAELYDDGGSSGSTDLIAGDGVFRNHFLGTDVSAEEGIYLFTFNISDKLGNVANEFTKDVTFNFNTAPQLLSATLLDTLKSGTEPLVLNAVAVDADGSPENTSVFMDLLFDSSSVFLEPIQLANDGNIASNGDTFAGDSVYSLKIDSTFAAGKKGLYTMVFVSEDEFGDKSNAIKNNIFIENKNPVIGDLSAPPTIEKPSGQEINTALLTLHVRDEQGLADIDSVYFNSIKPDGSPASGNPFLMLDNGTEGDEKANDGIFSVTILIQSINDSGTYEFTFYARDKAGNISNSITHMIEVQ